MGTPLEGTYFQAKLGNAICVQSLDDSLNSAIHITYRISLRSSSLREPRYPSTGVVVRFVGVAPSRGGTPRSQNERGARPDGRLGWGGTEPRGKRSREATRPHAHSRNDASSYTRPHAHARLTDRAAPLPLQKRRERAAPPPTRSTQRPGGG